MAISVLKLVELFQNGESENILTFEKAEFEKAFRGSIETQREFQLRLNIGLEPFNLVMSSGVNIVAVFKDADFAPFKSILSSRILKDSVFKSLGNILIPDWNGRLSDEAVASMNASGKLEARPSKSHNKWEAVEIVSFTLSEDLRGQVGVRTVSHQDDWTVPDHPDFIRYVDVKAS